MPHRFGNRYSCNSGESFYFLHMDVLSVFRLPGLCSTSSLGLRASHAHLPIIRIVSNWIPVSPLGTCQHQPADIAFLRYISDPFSHENGEVEMPVGSETSRRPVSAGKSSRYKGDFISLFVRESLGDHPHCCFSPSLCVSKHRGLHG